MRLVRPNQPSFLGTTVEEVCSALAAVDPASDNPYIIVEDDDERFRYVQAWVQPDRYDLLYREREDGSMFQASVDDLAAQRVLAVFLSGGDILALAEWEPLDLSIEATAEAFYAGSTIQSMPDQRRSRIIREQWWGILIGLIVVAFLLYHLALPGCL